MPHRFLLTAALVVALTACAAPSDEGSTASTTPASGAPDADLAINLSDFMLDPSAVEAAGPTIAVDVTNDGPTPHNLSMRDAAGEVVAATEDLSAGDSETLTVELEAGDYTIFCALAGHESLGMTGTLTVTAP